MANKIQIKRGTEANLPTLDVGELGFCIDTGKLYVGGVSDNTCINPDLTLAAVNGIVKCNGSGIYSAAAAGTDYVAPSGTVAKATQLETARTISLTGDATGSGSFNGTANLPITVTVVDDSHNHVISNVDNLQTALDGKVSTARTINAKALSADITLNASDVGAVATTLVGAASGVASLDSSGRVPASQLPAYVDDVINLLSVTTAPAACVAGDKYYNSTSLLIYTATGTNTWGTTGATPLDGVIYINTVDNRTYRWSGTALIEISGSLALGTTSSTAYRGDYGNTAYLHSQLTSGNPHNVSLSNLSITATATEINYLQNVTSAVQTQLNGKAATSHTHSEYVNQNAFSNVVVGANTIAADTTTDTLTIVAGTNVTIVADVANDTITISSTDTVYSHPTYSATGTTSSASPSAGGTFTCIDTVTTNTTGHLTGYNTKTITLPGDTKVTQTITTANADYRILLSESANDTTTTEGAKKASAFKYNPSTGTLTVGVIDGATIDGGTF